MRPDPPVALLEVAPLPPPPEVEDADVATALLATALLRHALTQRSQLCGLRAFHELPPDPDCPPAKED
ncbi:MAG: hypothetical protein AAFW69_07330 [Pseudomonadota bacterium]